MVRYSFIFLFSLLCLATWGQNTAIIEQLCDIKEKDIYIRQTIDLQGKYIKIANDKTLIFEGGMLVNGIIDGQNTNIKAKETEQIFGDNLDVKGTWAVPASPEWFGAKGDGINYYDQPLRCYNDIVSNIKSSSEKSRVKIAYPSSHIVNKDFWDFTPKYTTDDVFYDASNQCFVICIANVYYDKWANSDEWNDPKTSKARTDVLFSNLNTRVTTFYKNGQMTDIDSTMTDDALAISKAIKMGMGNVSLRPTIYYMKGMPTDGINKTYWRGLQNFHFKGNHATIFVRSHSKGSPYQFSQPSWAYMYQCKQGIISHLQIKSLRDRDDGTPKGHHRFDSSDSRFAAFTVINCEDITFQDVTFQGMSHDFIFKSKSDSDISRNIRIDGWKSTNFSQNVLGGVHGCHISHADLTQADLIGDGLHVFYGQSRLKGLFVSNSHFRQGGPYTSVMLTHHGGSQRKETCPDSIFYDNCVIEGARMVQGAGGQHQHFRNCTFKQTYDNLLLSKGTLSANKYIIIGTGVNLLFDNCIFKLNSSGVINTSFAKGKDLSFSLNNCTIQAPKVSNSLIIHPGIISINNCIISCKGTVLSSQKPARLSCQRLQVNGKLINKHL